MMIFVFVGFGIFMLFVGYMVGHVLGSYYSREDVAQIITSLKEDSNNNGDDDERETMYEKQERSDGEVLDLNNITDEWEDVEITAVTDISRKKTENN